jgi:hypothetical protein
MNATRSSLLNAPDLKRMQILALMALRVMLRYEPACPHLEAITLMTYRNNASV